MFWSGTSWNSKPLKSDHQQALDSLRKTLMLRNWCPSYRNLGLCDQEGASFPIFHVQCSLISPDHFSLSFCQLFDSHIIRVRMKLLNTAVTRPVPLTPTLSEDHTHLLLSLRHTLLSNYALLSSENSRNWKTYTHTHTCTHAHGHTHTLPYNNTSSDAHQCKEMYTAHT